MDPSASTQNAATPTSAPTLTGAKLLEASSKTSNLSITYLPQPSSLFDLLDRIDANLDRALRQIRGAA
jgi:hypothetical protein